MKKENFLGTIIISNEENRDIFRVHIFEESIRFDSYFAYGVSKNEILYDRIDHVNELWVSGEITRNDIFPYIIEAVEPFSNYLEDYYFKEEELSTTGKLKNLSLLNPNFDKEYMHFMYLRNKNKLKKITKKEFEENIVNQDIANFYIDNYMKKGAKFYKYTLIDKYKQEEKPCYFMIASDKVKIGFISNKK